MKILFMYILPSGGMNTVNRLRIQALRLAGIEGHLLYFRPGSGMGDIEPDIPVFYTSDPEEIGHILHTFSYDAVVLTSSYHHLPIIRSLGYTGIIIFENSGVGPISQARQAMLEAKPYLDAYADGLMYPGTRHIGEIFRELHPHKPQFPIFNPVNPDLFGYIPSGENPDHPVLAWIGRLEPNKNWRDFLRIAAETAKYVKQVHLWMFTDPELSWPGEDEQMLQLTAELNMTHRITHYHSIPNRRMPDYLSRVADSGGVLLITSDTESFAYAAPEAISCRCPVVTTDSDGVRAVIIEEVTGLYYPHGDIAAGARQVRRLVEQPALRKRLITNGMQRIRTKLSPTQYIRQFLHMLESLGVSR